MADKKLEVKCIQCGKERVVTRSMVWIINKGRGTGKCRSCASKGNKRLVGYKHSDETKQKMSLASFGKKKSFQHCKNISKGRKGIKFSEEHIKNLSISHMRGTELVKRQERNDPAYRNWVREVKKRDKGRCRISNKDCFGYCIVHHILPWRDFPELRYNINNGITLCQAHHPQRRAEEKQLIPFFRELVGYQMNLLGR